MSVTTKDILTAGVFLAAGVYLVNTYATDHLGQGARNLRLKIVNVNLDGTDIVLSVKVLNPNSQEMQVQSFVGEMMVNNQVVADIKMFGNYIARANGEVTIPLIARPRMGNLYKMLMQSFALPGGARITYAGTINVNNQPIPITLSYSK